MEQKDKLLDYIIKNNRIPDEHSDCELYELYQLYKETGDYNSTVKKSRKNLDNEIISFIFENKRTPNKETTKEGMHLRYYYYKHKERLSKLPEFKEAMKVVEEEKELQQKLHNDYMISHVQDFIKENGRIPKVLRHTECPYEASLRNWINHNLELPEIKEIREKYIRKLIPFEERLEDFLAFVKRMDRLPISREEGECKLYRFMNANKNKSEAVKEVYDYYKNKEKRV